MATLILGTVGRAVAGPVGGALGALVGNRLDNAVLGRRREGPRLTELAVQTSSYGTPIPLLFGTMRVAGTVIWSTDLIEHRDRSGGGKGRAATTTYSYAASFAVALSARPIVRVGRIWADGRLLRGSAGDLKVKTGFRLHRGGEDQAVDPLIASAEGRATPAYRGIAYAVFEDLPLAEFGNRQPSLTFEVVADEDGVDLDAVARITGARVPGGDGGATGLAAVGEARAVLGVVEQLAGGWWAPDGAGLALIRPGAPVATLVDVDARAAGLDGAGRVRRVAAARAGAVAVAHYDPARDYQAGLQRAGPAGVPADRVEVPAVIGAGEARTLAATLVARAAAARVRRTVTTGLGGLSVPPGAVVAIAGEAGTWRVVESAWEAMAVRLQLAPVATATPPRAASSGRVLPAPDAAIGRTLLRLVDLPAGDDALPTAPRLGVVAAGEGSGWRRAALLWSVDGGASWTEAGETAAPGIVGTVEAAPPPAPATLVDRAGGLVVRLAREDMMLADADADALDRGANLAMVGAELIQFGRAVPLPDGRWRLDALLRGRRGTEAAAMAAGDDFALLDPAGLRVVDLPLAALGGEVRVMAAGVGDDRPSTAQLAIEGRAIRPPAPAQLRAAPGATGVLLRWARRSRAGWRWVDGVDAPLAEEAERYRVTLIAAGGAERQVEVDAPVLPIAVAEWATIVRVEVRQRGTWAESRPATMGKGDTA